MIVPRSSLAANNPYLGGGRKLIKAILFDDLPGTETRCLGHPAGGDETSMLDLGDHLGTALGKANPLATETGSYSPHFEIETCITKNTE